MQGKGSQERDVQEQRDVGHREEDHEQRRLAVHVARQRLFVEHDALGCAARLARRLVAVPSVRDGRRLLVEDVLERHLSRARPPRVTPAGRRLRPPFGRRTKRRRRERVNGRDGERAVFRGGR